MSEAGASSTCSAPVPPSAKVHLDPDVQPMELEHAMGFSRVRNSIHAIPNSTRYIHLIGGCIIFCDSSNVHDQTFVRGHDEDVSCLCISKSGRYMVSGQHGHNSDVCLWDLETRRIIHRIAEHDGGIAAVDIMTDDTIIAAVGIDRRITFFDVSNGGMITHMPLAHLMQPDDAIRDCHFGGRVQDVKRRDTDAFHFCVCTTQLVLTFHLDPFAPSLTPSKLSIGSFQRRYSAARYSAYGDLLFIGSDSGDLAMFATTSGACLTIVRLCSLGVKEIRVHRPSDAEQQSIDARHEGFKYARFGPGSERRTTLFCGCGDGVVAECIVPEHGEAKIDIVAKRNIGEEVASVAIADGMQGQVIAASISGATYHITANPQVKNLTDGIVKLGDAITSPINALAAHPSCPDKFVTASHDGLLRQWDLNTYRIAGTFELPNSAKATATNGGNTTLTCSTVAISDGLEIQLSAWSDGCVRCHDMTNFGLLWTHARAHRASITALCVSPSMKYFVTGSVEGEIKIWDIRTRELKGELKDHTQAVVSLQLFDDDRHLASASKDRTVVTWDLVTFRRLTAHETHSGPLTSMLLCRNQCNVYTAGVDKQLALWDLRHKEPARVVPYSSSGSEAYCTCVRRSTDERLLATGGTDQVVQLWDERLMTVIATGYGHSGTVNDCAFTCDNKQIVSCGQDSAIMVWNVFA